MFEQSKWFFNEFNKIFSDYREEAVKKYQHNTKFTRFIMDKINDIIKTKYDCSNEYFRIDSMGYNSHYNDLERTGSFNRHLWDLEIAVEHENDKKDWLDEVIKLAHVCCPLRVVIGYVSIKDGRDDMRLLDYAANALQKLKCVYNVKNGEFLIILGNAGTKNKDEYFNYKAYVLDSETFKFNSLSNY